MSDSWEALEAVDVLPLLPKTFKELVVSKKWQERKEALEALLQLTTDNQKLDPNAAYGDIVTTLSRILAKDANINVCAVAANCITQLAKGLRTKFGPFAKMLVPIIFEKFKEKKAILKDPLVETIDAVYATTKVEVITDAIAAALSKPNPNVKIQANNFLYRVFTTFYAQTAPKNVVETLAPLVVKCANDSDPATREAAFSALGAIMMVIGKPNTMKMLGDVSGDKAKMTRIEEYCETATKEAAAAAAAQSSLTYSNANSNQEGTDEATTSSKAARAAEADPWEFMDPVDVLPKLPGDFYERIVNKKWQERKEALEVLLQLTTDHQRLDPNASYTELVKALAKILGKDVNINVCAVAAKCITRLAKGLRAKFGPYASLLVPIVFEKFKEKKAILKDPLVETIDAVYSTINVEVIVDDIAAALNKPNPNIKMQTNLFLSRVLKSLNPKTTPKKMESTLIPLVIKCAGESDAEVRDAAFAALAAFMKAIGKSKALAAFGDISGDKVKMAQIEKHYETMVEGAADGDVALVSYAAAPSNGSNKSAKTEKAVPPKSAATPRLKAVPPTPRNESVGKPVAKPPADRPKPNVTKAPANRVSIYANTASTKPNTPAKVVANSVKVNERGDAPKQSVKPVVANVAKPTKSVPPVVPKLPKYFNEPIINKKVHEGTRLPTTKSRLPQPGASVPVSARSGATAGVSVPSASRLPVPTRLPRPSTSRS